MCDIGAEAPHYDCLADLHADMEHLVEIGHVIAFMRDGELFYTHASNATEEISAIALSLEELRKVHAQIRSIVDRPN